MPSFAITRLFSGGIITNYFCSAECVRGLLLLATERCGYHPRRERYGSRCDLCNDIRAFLYERYPGRFAELGPAGYYLNFARE
jgi:hypothetical protein